jgi:hypothetical protein
MNWYIIYIPGFDPYAVFMEEEKIKKILDRDGLLGISKLGGYRAATSSVEDQELIKAARS